MIGENRAAAIKVKSDKGVMPSADAVGLGLIVTELVINALKYAFPDAGKPGTVMVHYEVNGGDWKLTVSDDGVGRTDAGGHSGKGGLGTSLVAALANRAGRQGGDRQRRARHEHRGYPLQLCFQGRGLKISGRKNTAPRSPGQ